MATKSRVRKKNGKPVKYKPKPKGLSKTQMKKLLEIMEEQQKLQRENPNQIPEIRSGEGELLISPNFTKKINLNPSDNIEEGPELSIKEKEEISSIKEEDTLENNEENTDEGPASSDI